MKTLILSIFLVIGVSSACFAQDRVYVKDYSCKKSRNGAYLYIKGVVANDTRQTARHVKVTAICRTWSEKFVDTGTADARPSTIAPDGEAGFQIKVAYNGEIDQDKVKFEVEYK
jgi:hypothetical protein